METDIPDRADNILDITDWRLFVVRVFTDSASESRNPPAANVETVGEPRGWKAVCVCVSVCVCVCVCVRVYVKNTHMSTYTQHIVYSTKPQQSGSPEEESCKVQTYELTLFTVMYCVGKVMML